MPPRSSAPNGIEAATLERFVLALAGTLGALGVAMGAWAAHGMATHFGPDAADLAATGAVYQLVHILAALAALWLRRIVVRPVPAAAACVLFALGAILFPGALYGLAFGGPGILGAVAPIGGTSFVLGWICLGLTALRGLRDPT